LRRHRSYAASINDCLSRRTTRDITPAAGRSSRRDGSFSNRCRQCRTWGTLWSWPSQPAHDRGATSPVIADRAASTSSAVLKRTSEQRVRHGPRRQPTHLCRRQKPMPPRRRERPRTRRSSPGRRPLAGSCHERGCRAKLAA